MSQHRPALINPDTRGALAVALLATAALVGISFTLSYAGLSALAPWAAVPAHLAALIPLFIDGAIGVYTYSALAARARAESAARPWTWVALWTLVSSAANAAHAWGNGPGEWQGIVGAVLAGLFPIGSLLGTHEIADRMIGRPESNTVDGDGYELAGPLHIVDLDHVRQRFENVRKPRPARRARLARRAAELHALGKTVREIGADLKVSKSYAHTLIKEAQSA